MRRQRRAVPETDPFFLVVLIAALAGLSYAWALGSDPLETYYAAAVRSMSTSWHNFIFGAFDPAGTITLDKLPGAFWLQALAVRAFGLHTWVIVAPQAIEGVLTVLVLYRAVMRLAGPVAGIIACGVVAASPATIALNRGNISDSLMILLAVLAADAVSGAIVDGRTNKLILAAVCIGLAFQAKMIEAWLVLPALGLAYLLSGPGSTLGRVRQVVIAAVVTAAVSLSWMIAVSLVPASQRPYVDGSQDNSIFQQVFVYNGFSRFGDHTPLQLLAGQSLGIHLPGSVTASPGLLLHGDLGRDTGWLIPAALIVGVLAIASRRRRPRTDSIRASLVLWGVWLVILGVTFSASTQINSYYTAALSPALGAILGTGVAAAWSGERSAIGRRAALAVIVAATVAYAVWLVHTAGSRAPAWLIPAVIAAGIVALGTVGASVLLRSDWILAGALVAGLVAGILAPAVAGAQMAVQRRGAFDTPFETVGQALALDTIFQRAPALAKAAIPNLEAVQNGAPYLLATETSALASVFIYASGLEALPIGGFTGTIPSPTLSQLQQDVSQGKFHLVIEGASKDPRAEWIAAHCLSAPSPIAGLYNYFCRPADAG